MRLLTVCSCCCASPRARRTATIESELEPILAGDAPPFVMKLKRLIIYECERTALTSSSSS